MDLPGRPETGGARRGFVDADDAALHYVESGRGPGLVFVPGWMATVDFWEPQLRHFSSRYRAVAFDPRSQGDSTKTEGGNCTERRARDLKILLERLALAPAVVVAWSMGVTDVLSLLDQFGSSGIRAVALVDGPIVSLARSPGVWAWFVGDMRQMQRDRAARDAAFVRRLLRRPHPGTLYRRLEAALRKTRTDTAAALAFDSLDFDFQAALRQADVPLMFVGRHEDPGGQAEIFRRNRPGDRIELRDDVGHAVFLDDADWFNGVLDDFLASLQA